MTAKVVATATKKAEVKTKAKKPRKKRAKYPEQLPKKRTSNEVKMKCVGCGSESMQPITKGKLPERCVSCSSELYVREPGIPGMDSQRQDGVFHGDVTHRLFS